MSDWTHRDVWSRPGDGFLVTVEHFERTSKFQGPHRWAVYAYIYRDHPHRAAIEADPPPPDGLWSDATRALPIHGGVSYVWRHVDRQGNLASWQIGGDYNHLHDAFDLCASPFEAAEVFRDADALWTWLDARKAAS